MALQSDSQGFLVGDPIDISRVVDQLRRIRSDVSEIKRALLSASSNNSDSRNSRSSSGGSNPRVRRGRDNSGSSSSGENNSNRSGNGANTRTNRTQGNSDGGAATPNRPRSSNSSGADLPPVNTSGAATPNDLPPINASGTATPNDLLPVNANGTATPNRRGRDGRFLGNGQSEDGSDNPRMQGFFGGLADRIVTAVKVSAAGTEEADPTIKAFQEVAEPMQRGYEIFFGGGDKKERWYKKIFGVLSKFRKEESVFNQAANRSLHNIEENPGVSSGEGGQSFLGGLLGSISPWVMAAITSIGGALLAGIGTVLGVIFSPIGLAIGAASAVAWGLFTESGQKFFGEVGAKIIAGWDGVVTTFSPITESISKGWDTVKGGFDSLINGMVSSWDAFTGFLKDKFGIDLPSILKPVVDAGKKAVEATKETVKAGTDAAKSTASKAVEAVEKSSPKTTQALGKAWDKIKSIGDVLRGGESGKEGYNAYNRGTGLGSNGHRDLTNMTLADIQAAQALPRSDKGRLMAVGKYQMMPSTLKEGAQALNLGSDTKFDEATQEKLFSQYLLGKKRPQIQDYITGKSDDAQAAQIAGAKEWRSIADPRTGKTYADKGASGNKASISSDEWLSSMDAAKKQYQENLKLGLNETEAYSNAVSGLQAVTAKAPAINEAETQAATPSLADDPSQGGRYKYEKLEGDKIQVTDSQEGAISLASDEQANAFRKQEGKSYLDQIAAINANDMPLYHRLAAGPGNAQVQIASATSPRVPTFAPPPPIAEAPPLIQPLASDSNRNITVSMPTPDVGQDVRDRGIAHIVTGGMSGRG